MFPTLPNRTDCFVGRDPESGSISHYINPLSCDMPFISHFKDDRNISRATDRSFEGFLVFIELNFLLYLIFSRHRRQQNPAPAQPGITPKPTTQKEKEATESMGPALDTAERGERLLQNTLGRTDHY